LGEGGSEERGELIRRCGEGSDPTGGKGLGKGVVVAGCPLIIQGEKAEDVDAARDEASSAGNHWPMGIFRERSTRRWSVMKVTYQQENGLLGRGDQLIAVVKSSLQICPTTQMESEEDLERVFGVCGEVDNFGVKGHKVGRERRKARQDRGIDPGIDGRRKHRCALIEADDDLAPGGSSPRPSVETNWEKDLAVWLVVAKVGPDRTGPIDLGSTTRGVRPGLALGLLDGLFERDRELGGQRVDDLANEAAGQLASSGWETSRERQQGGGEFSRGPDLIANLRLEKERETIEPSEGLLLEQANTLGRKAEANVPQPIGQHGEGRSTSPRPGLFRSAVEKIECRRQDTGMIGKCPFKSTQRARWSG
jgi:hypothetical protein